jgi:hypothetical protein
VNSNGSIGPVLIRGSLIGGSGLESGQVFTNSNVTRITIVGSLIGGTNTGTGEVLARNLGAVTIGGNLVGGSASGTADLEDSGHIEARNRIVSVLIGGSVIAGTDRTIGRFFGSGAIQAGDDLGPVTVRGSLVGNRTNSVLITARGQGFVPAGSHKDVAIASLTVGGRVELAEILAGYDRNLHEVNADAQIGAVTVGRDWIASDLVAGIDPGADDFFGTADDVVINEAGADPNILAQIASVTIKGQALTTTGGPDHFGIVAQKVGALSLGGVAVPLKAGVDVLALGATGDFTLREVV